MQSGSWGSRVTFSTESEYPLRICYAVDSPQFWHTLTHGNKSSIASGTHIHTLSHEDIRMQALTETYPNMFELDAFSWCYLTPGSLAYPHIPIPILTSLHPHILTGIIMTYTHTHSPFARTQIRMSAKVYCIATFELQHSMSEVCRLCLRRRRCHGLCCGRRFRIPGPAKSEGCKIPTAVPEIRRRALRQRANNNGPYVLYNKRGVHKPCTEKSEVLNERIRKKDTNLR